MLNGLAPINIHGNEHLMSDEALNELGTKARCLNFYLK